MNARRRAARRRNWRTRGPVVFSMRNPDTYVWDGTTYVVQPGVEFTVRARGPWFKHRGRGRKGAR